MNSAPLITGAGAHVFAVEHDWLRPPPDLAWGDTHGLAQDSAGRIYVAHTVGPASLGSEAILVFSEEGEALGGFGAEFRGGAHGLAIRAEPEGEFLYLTDVIRCQVVKLTLEGEVVWRKAYPRAVPGYRAALVPYCPTNVAFAPDGGFFVADGYGADRVLRYDAAGRFLAALGRSGAGEGEFRCPHGVWVDTRGGGEPRLVVADRGNSRLQLFTLDGAFLATVRDALRLRWPCHFHQRGDLLVCPDLDSQVCLLDRDYRVVAQLGDGQSLNGPVGSRRWQARGDFTPGRFIAPHGAIFLRNGDLLVAEWVTVGRITRLRRVAASAPAA